MLLHMQVVRACPDDTVVAALRRHRRAMCRAIGRPRFADATGSMDPGALPLLSVSLLTAGHAASQSAAAQLEVLQVWPLHFSASSGCCCHLPPQAFSRFVKD